MPQVKVGWRSGSVAAPSVSAILLDTYSGAAAAYSLRRLRTGYTGSAIRVRRSSDNTELNIGFDANGDLDTYALSAFVGTGNGFVTIWYDQSGNSSNLIQITATLQMRIVGGGVIETINGKPALVNNYNYAYKGEYNATYATPISSPVTMFNIGSNTQVPGAGYLWNGLNSNMYVYSYWTDWMRIGGSTEFALQGYLQNISKQRIINAVYNGSSSKLSINNGSYSTGNVGNSTSNGLKLGSSGYGAPAFYQEHIVYPSDKSTDISLIDSNINSYYSIYPNPTSVWNLLAAAYNADTTASSSLKTSLFAAYNGESNTNDSFGTNNGTAQGGLTYTTGKIGNAFQFNGTNAYVSLPRTTNEFDFTGDFSISVWIKPTTQGTANYIFQNYYETSPSNRFGFKFYIQNGRVRFGTYNITTNLANGSTVISNNTWYHVVITKTSGNAYKMYVNNTLQTLTLVLGDISNNASYNSLNQVNIGSTLDYNGRFFYFNGQIDALNTWSKELTQSEITELYNSGNGAQYITDNFYKTTPNDALNTNNGTAVGGLTYGLGKVGTAFQFNGTNAYVQLGDVMDIGTNSQSYAFWVKANVLNPSTYQTVFSKSRSAGVTGRVWCTFFGNNLQFNFHAGLNNGGDVIHTQSVLAFNTDTWYHVVCVLDRNDKLKMYINGSLATNISVIADQAYIASNNLIPYLNVNYDTNIPFRIGSYTGADNATPTGFFNGSVDAFCIWNKVLTGSEVTELYNSGNGKQYPN